MMNSDEQSHSIHAERVDADAVCQQCATVNPENTLICKTCGNNLRDQRANRMVETYDLEGIPQVRQSFVFLRVALIVLGILIFIWLGMNLGRIEDMMVQAQMSKVSDLGRFWKGPLKTEYDELAKTLSGGSVTEAQIRSAVATPLNSKTMDGRYVLFARNNTTNPLGLVVFKTNGDKVQFIVVVFDTENETRIEIRGEALQEEPTRLTCSGDASFGGPDEYFDGTGFATKLENGTLNCYARSNYSENSYSVTAYLIPEGVPAGGSAYGQR